ncbi:MAG: prenyltransferase/squalene oxidase repeat-containing protein [Planctomycetota bacterium]
MRALLAGLALAALPLAGRADDAPDRTGGGSPPPNAGQGPSTAERAGDEALARGLAWLARQQDVTDGSFPKLEAREWAPVGVTSLAALAFLAGGSSPGRGPYGAEVSRSIGYLLAHADLDSGSRHPGYIAVDGDPLSRTHGHGFATLALAQVYGMSARPEERLERVLVAAVRRIEAAQGAEGGWYYEPEASANHEGSVTVCLVQALRAARNAGIAVDAKVIHCAEDYVLRLRKEDGTFRYQLDVERSSVALTAAGVSTLNMAGRYDDAVIRASIDAIWNLLALRREEGHSPDYPEYERLYLAQALWQLADRSLFDRWFAETRTELVRQQRPDGSWSSLPYGNCYATAMNCLVLALPGGLLPIFQR